VKLRKTRSADVYGDFKHIYLNFIGGTEGETLVCFELSTDPFLKKFS